MNSSTKAKKNRMQLFLTCEHGGHEIPKSYTKYFSDHAVLSSHRGWDIGALKAARHLSVALGAPLYHATISRLLVELNRSIQHPKLFSDFTSVLKPAEKKQLLEEYYFPYRNEVERKIKETAADATVLHISVHSFTPILHGQARNAAIGLLYDPRRPDEKQFCQQLKTSLLEELPDLKIRLNYPYRGTSDGFTTYLRKRFAKNYIGIELEINQKNLIEEGDVITSAVSAAIKRII